MPSLGNQEYIRDMNSRLVLQHIIHHGPISRADISKTLGLTKATVSSIIQTFIDDGYVQEIGSLDTTKGRKPILLQFNGNCGFTLSVYLDVDATSILIASLTGEQRQFFAYPGIANAPVPAEKLCEYIQDAISHCPPSRYHIVGIAVGVLGVVHKNRIEFTPYYDLGCPDLGFLLKQRFHIPVYIENEANLAAQGERTFFHFYPNLINLNIHAGIGMGIILDHRLYTGQNGYAGEFGHTIIEPGGKPCPCGNRGCIEQYASRRAIVSMFREITKDSQMTAADLCRAYNEGRPEAVRCIDIFVRYMAIALNNILNIFNPDIVIINSDFTTGIPGLTEEISRHMRNTFNRNCTFVPASQDQETVILLGGCCVCAKQFLKIKDLQLKT